VLGCIKELIQHNAQNIDCRHEGFARPVLLVQHIRDGAPVAANEWVTHIPHAAENHALLGMRPTISDEQE